MHAEVRAYAVACAVQVIDALAPHELASQYVELGAGGALREDGSCQGDMAFEHQCVDVALLFSDRTEGNRAGDIRRSVLILRSAVQQQQAMRLQGDVGLRSSFIVNDGSMLFVARNRVE